jgi:hypothetical protein
MKQSADQTDDLIYNERVSSNWTEALFLALTLLFFLLLIWRVNAGSPDVLAAVFFCLFSLFFLLGELQNTHYPSHLGVSEAHIWHLHMDCAIG